MSKQSLKNTNQLYLSFDALPKQSPPETVAFIRAARVISKAKSAKTSLAACSSDQVASPAIVSSKLATTKPSPETVLLGEDHIAQSPYDASSLRLLGDCAALIEGTPGKVEGSPNAADALSARMLTDAPAASLARSGEGQPCRQVGAGPCITLSEPARERAGEMKTPSEQFEVARTNDISLEDVGTLSVGAPANDDERCLDLFGETRRVQAPSVRQLARALNEEPGRNDAAHGAADLVSGDGSLLIPAAPNAKLHADRHQIDPFAKASTRPASAEAPAACTATRNPCRPGDTLIEQHLPEISDGATVAGHPKNILESDASGSAPLDPSDFSKDQTEDGEAIRVDGLLQLSAEVDGPALDAPQGLAPQKLERKPRYRERPTSAELVTATMAADFPDAAAIFSTAEASATVRPAAPCEGPESGDVGSDLRTADPRTAHAREVTEPTLEFEARTDREPTPASDADEKILDAVDAHVVPVASAAGQRDGDPDLLGDHVRTEPPRRTRRRRLPWRPEGRRCSSEVEAEADRLAELIDAAPDGDDDPLTMVETVMRLDDVPLREIVTRGPLALADRLSKGLPHRHTGRHREITKPDEKARRVFYCLYRLKEQNPGDPLLPEIEDAKPYTKLPSVRLDLEAAAFKADVERWGVMSKQERGRETGDGRALDDVTRQSYGRDVRSVYAAAVELKLVGVSCSVATLGAPDVAGPVIAFLKTLYTPANVASMVAALARVAADLYGTDPGHTRAIDFLLAEAKRLFPDQELSDAAVARYANLTSDPLMMQTIFDAPRAMMARSGAPSLKPLDRFARASRAVAAQLKLESVGLDAADAARLDFDEHFRRNNGVLQMRLPDLRERGRFRWDPCTPDAEALIKEWLELKDREGIDGSLLFPSENDPKVPQLPRIAMAGVYDDFAQVTGEYLTFSDIKTLRLYKALLKYPDKWRAIAEAACYKDPRSLARRLHIVLDRRRDEGAP